jgi:hypothetical protein
MASMPHPTAYALQFRGEAIALGGGRFRVESRASSCVFVTVVGRGGVDGRFQQVGQGEAVCKREIEMHEDGTLFESGEIAFAAGEAITFHARGVYRTSPDPRLRHGTAVCEVTGGRGRMAATRGFITSNFLLSETGELTDHHLGLLFIERPDIEDT